MAVENPAWGAPRIHGEIQKLGFVISERTVARYLRRMHRHRDPAKRWLTFLRNHREVTVAFDFFTVSTVTFRLLYCFFVIEHNRRRILHFNVTRHPHPGLGDSTEITTGIAAERRDYETLQRDFEELLCRLNLFDLEEDTLP